MKDTRSALLLTRIENDSRVWLYDQFTQKQLQEMRGKGWSLITDASQARYERGRKDESAKRVPL